MSLIARHAPVVFRVPFLIVTALFLAPPGNATNPVWDEININGERRFVYQYPLANFWPRKHRSRFDSISSANRKGYTTSWEIRDSQLFLISFNATIDGKPADPKNIFDGQELPIRADWYSGVLAVVKRPFPRFSDQTPITSATLFLIDHGFVQQIRDAPGMRFENTSPKIDLTLQRDSGRFVVSNPRMNIKGVPELITGSIVHGLIDRNGFSINFTDESEELANALLHTHFSRGLTLFVSSPPNHRVIRRVEIEYRESPWGGKTNSPF